MHALRVVHVDYSQARFIKQIAQEYRNKDRNALPSYALDMVMVMIGACVM